MSSRACSGCRCTRTSMSRRSRTGFDDVVAAMSIDGLFSTRRKIAIATGDSLTPRMAGPAIRAWQIALALSRSTTCGWCRPSGRTEHPDFECTSSTPPRWPSSRRGATSSSSRATSSTSTR